MIKQLYKGACHASTCLLRTSVMGLFVLCLGTILAQEPANLGNYTIRDIGKAQNTFTENQWYIMGRNKTMVDNGATNGYVYEDLTPTTCEDITSTIDNAACTGTDFQAPANWSISGNSGGSFQVNTHSGTFPEACSGFGGVPYIEYWTGSPSTLSDATITHDIISTEPGYYQVTIDARMYDEGGQNAPSGISFFVNDQSVSLTTGTAATNNQGYYGTYKLMAYVGADGALKIGFKVSGANCNWLAFKNVTVQRVSLGTVTTEEKLNETESEGNGYVSNWSVTGNDVGASLQFDYWSTGNGWSNNFEELWVYIGDYAGTEYNVVGTITKTLTCQPNYGQGTFTVDGTTIESWLGGTPTIAYLNSDGTFGSRTAGGTYGGAWFNEYGNTTTWGNNSHVYIEDTGSLYGWAYGGYPGICQDGDTHTVTILYQYGTKVVKLVVTFNIAADATAGVTSSTSTSSSTTLTRPAQSLSNGTLSHTQLTGYETGTYQVSIDANMYSEAGNTPSGVTFYANSSSIDLTTGTASGTNCISGTYSLEATVTDAGTLDIGFTINNANFNWLAFKNLIVKKVNFAKELEDKTSLVTNAACTGDNRTTPANWSRETETGPFDVISTENLGGQSLSTSYIEYWRYSGEGAVADNKISHDAVTGLTPGTYLLTVEVAMTSEAGNATISGASLFANDSEVALTGTVTNPVGGMTAIHDTYSIIATVNGDGVLNFGFNITSATFNWFTFKNVTLKYIGTFPGLSNGLSITNGIANTVSTGDVASNDKQYLVRFVYAGASSVDATNYRTYYNIQLGTGNYVEAVSGNGQVMQTSSTAGKYFVYTGEGYYKASDGETEEWTTANGVFLNATADGTTYDYFLQANATQLNLYSNNDGAGQWSTITGDLGNRVFTLYPVTLCETSPTVPSVTQPDASTKTAPKFYTIKNKANNDYACYSDITEGYVVMDKAAADGYGIWWFENCKATEGYGPNISGTKKVKIHNVMISGSSMVSPTTAATSTGTPYYLLPATVGGTTGIAISRNEYSAMNDSWYSAAETISEIGQTSNVQWENTYNLATNTLWEFEEISAAGAWTTVWKTLKNDMHPGTYFTPSTTKVNELFAKYETAPSAANFFTQLSKLRNEIKTLATGDDIPTKLPEAGGRFYLENRAVPGHYLAYGTDSDTGEECLTITTADKPEAADVWEFIPYGDPKKVVLLRDQPKDNSFYSWQYDSIEHHTLQRYWVRNRATGHFLSHQPAVDLGGGKYNRHTTELETKTSLEREDADLWYLDVVERRDSIRSAVLRTKFIYDYSPWDGANAATKTEGDPTDGYGYPVVQWSLSRHRYNISGGSPKIKPLQAWGCTYTDPTKAFSEWLVYEVKSDMLEQNTDGVNYVLKNMESNKYVYYDSTTGKFGQCDDYADQNGAAVWMFKYDTGSGGYTIQNQGTDMLYFTNLDSEGGSFGTSAPSNYVYSFTAELQKTDEDVRGTQLSVGDNELPSTTCWSNSSDGTTLAAGNSTDSNSQPIIGSMFQLDKLDRYYDDAIYELNNIKESAEITESSPNKIFYVNSTVQQQWKDLIANFQQGKLAASTLYTDYTSIKSVLDGVNDKMYNLPVSGTRYLIQNKESGLYLTNYGKIIGVENPNYYSVWTLVSSGNTIITYKFINDGAANAMEAGAAHGKNDAKYLYYNKDGFIMSTSGSNFHFKPDGAGYAMFSSNRYETGSYDYRDSMAYCPTYGDHIVIPQKSLSSNQNEYWTVVELTPDLEKTIYQNSIKDMAEHSGGPVTTDLTGVDEELAEISDIKALNTLAAGTPSAANYGTYVNSVWNLDEGRQYMQWAAGDPIYLENVNYPKPTSRLKYDSANNKWKSVVTHIDTDPYQIFMFDSVQASGYKYALKNIGTGTYIRDDGALSLTKYKSYYDRFQIKEVIPGIYTIKNKSSKYLSLDEDDNLCLNANCGYGSLWRIKCNSYVHELDGKGLSDTDNNTFAEFDNETGLYFTSFSSTNDTRIAKTSPNTIVPYYATTIGQTDEKKATITLVPAESVDGYYLLHRNWGYVIVKKGSAFTANDVMNYGVFRGTSDLTSANILRATDTDITTSGQDGVYMVLGKNSNSVTFKPLKGTGGKIAAGKAYISNETLTNAGFKYDKSAYAWVHDSKAQMENVDENCIELELNLEDGSVTSINGINLGESENEPVYDLAGRRVTTPQRGVYIKGGQKLIKK